MPALTPLVCETQTASIESAPFTYQFPVRPPSDMLSNSTPNRPVGGTSYRKQLRCHVTSIPKQPAVVAATSSSSTLPEVFSSSNVTRQCPPAPDAIPSLAMLPTPLVSDMPTTSTGGDLLTHVTQVMPRFHVSASYQKQPTRHVTSVPRQPPPAAAVADEGLSLSSFSGICSSSNVVCPQRRPLDTVPHQQVWPVWRPLPPQNALRSAGQPPLTTFLSSSSYLNLRSDARVSVPSASNTMQVSTMHNVGIRSTPHLLSVPRGDFQQSDRQPKQHIHVQQLQQRHQWVPGVSSQSQPILLMMQHRRLTDYFMHQAECSLNAVLSQLSGASALMNAPSPSQQKVFNLLRLLDDQVNTASWQYRTEYSRAYNVLVASAQTAFGRVGLARINPNFVRENLRVVLMCSQGLEAVTLKLRRLLLSMSTCRTKETAGIVEAAILWHINEFQRVVGLFSDTLVAYTMKIFGRPLAPTANHTVDYYNTHSQFMPSSGSDRTTLLMSEEDPCRQSADDDKEPTSSVQKAFTDDVDRLLSQQQQQQQSVILTSPTCEAVAVSTPSFVDGLCDSIRPVDNSSTMQELAVLHRNTNIAHQIDSLETKSTSMDMEDSHQSEVKFSHAIQSRQQVQRTDLDSVITDNDHNNDADLQPDHDSHLADPCGKDLTDCLDSKTQVARAVDLMSLGGFSLFVPFLPTADRQPEESGTRSVGSAGLSSDSADSGIIVKQEQCDFIEDPLSSADDVVDAPEQENADASLPAFVGPKADVAAVDDKNFICRIENVFSVPPDGLSVPGSSLLCSSAELPQPKFDGVPATGKHSSPEHRNNIYTLVSSTTRSTSKIVDVNVPRRRSRRHRQQSLELTTCEIIGTVRKRKTCEDCSTEDYKRKRARNTYTQTSTSMSDKPTVFSATTWTSHSSWVPEKKLIIPPAVVKRRRGRPPKRHMDTLVMPSPAELKRRPAARRKILAMYRSAQFTPLDGSNRTNISVPCRWPKSNEQPHDPKPGGQGKGHSRQRASFSGDQCAKTTGNCNKYVKFSTSQAAVSNVASAPKTPINVDRSKKPSSSLWNHAKSFLADADYSTNQSPMKSSAAIESTATMGSDASCSIPLPSDNRNKKNYSTSMKMSSVDKSARTDHPAATGVDENSPTLARTGVHVAAETTFAIASHSCLYDATNIETNDDDEDPDRLVIDLDRKDPYKSASDCSVLSDHCNNCDTNPAASTKNECPSADENDKKNPTSINVGCLLETGEVIVATDKPSSPDCCLETTSGNRVTTSTSSDLLPVGSSTLDNYSSRSTLNCMYSDISEDEDDDECVTSTAGARIFARDGETLDRQQLVKLPTLKYIGASAAMSQTMNFGSPVGHSNDVDLNHNLEYVEVYKPHSGILVSKL